MELDCDVTTIPHYPTTTPTTAPSPTPTPTSTPTPTPPTETTPAPTTQSTTPEPESTTTTQNQELCNDIDFMILNDASRNVGSLDQTLNCDSMNLHTSPDWRGTGNSIYFLKIVSYSSKN